MNDRFALIRSVARWNGDAFQWWPDVTIAVGSYEAVQAAGRLCGYTGPQLDYTGMSRGMGDWWYIAPGQHYRIKQRPFLFVYESEADKAERRRQSEIWWLLCDLGFAPAIEASKRAEKYIRDSRALRGLP